MTNTPPATEPTDNQDSTIQLDRAQLKDAVAAHKQKHQTGELRQEDKMDLPFNTSLPYGLHTRGITEYVVLPASNPAGGPHWLISFNGLGPEKAAVGIEVAGDVVLGTTRGGAGFPDFDFGKYQADQHGVSRHHAVIRPSHSKLYLIDLRSTNGTRVNALPTNPGMAMELQNGDAISLGTLTFTVNVLATPGDLAKMKEAKAKASAEPTASPPAAPPQPLITAAPTTAPASQAAQPESKPEAAASAAAPVEAKPLEPAASGALEAAKVESKPDGGTSAAAPVEAKPLEPTASGALEAARVESKPEAAASVAAPVAAKPLEPAASSVPEVAKVESKPDANASQPPKTEVTAVDTAASQAPQAAAPTAAPSGDGKSAEAPKPAATEPSTPSEPKPEV